MTNKDLYLYSQLRQLKGQISAPSKFQAIQALVRSNTASRFFTVHESQLTSTRAAATLTWDILGINHDTPSDPQYTRSMTLQLHDCFPTVGQFDPREAFYYAETAMPAGIYHVTIGEHSWVSGDVGKTVQFALTQGVPAGGQLVFNQMYNITCVGNTVSTFAGGTSTSAIETVTMTEGNSGASLGTIDNTVQTHLNSMQRALMGSNNYKESAIRQWLNSDQPAGNVWTPQTKWDRPPAWVSTEDGFMYGMDTDFLAAIGRTHIVVSRNTVCDGGGYDEMDDYFFLLSSSEIYMGNEVESVIEGKPYPYYSDYSELPAAGSGADTNRIKYKNGAAQYWILRSPYSKSGNNVIDALTTGSRNFANASYTYGAVPACNII